MGVTPPVVPPGALTVREGLARPGVPAADRTIPAADRPAVKDAIEAAWADSTKRMYRIGWDHFASFCEKEARQALPAAVETVVLFLTKSSLGVPMLAHCVAGIAYRHRLAGFDPPPTAAVEVKVVWKGIRRRRLRTRNAKAPITLTELPGLLAKVNRREPRGKRDAAVLLLGFWSAMRREEIAAIRVEHLREDADGLSIFIPKSKTDQEHEGAWVGLARQDETPDLCPVRAVVTLREDLDITAGPLFRGFLPTGDVRAKSMHPQEVARIVKRACVAAGLDPARFAGHSLRRGHVTEAYRQEVPEAQIQAQTRHATADMLRRYRDEANPVARGSTRHMKPRR